jgi:hypothetical protein
MSSLRHGGRVGKGQRALKVGLLHIEGAGIERSWCLVLSRSLELCHRDWIALKALSLVCEGNCRFIRVVLEQYEVAAVLNEMACAHITTTSSFVS